MGGLGARGRLLVATRAGAIELRDGAKVVASHAFAGSAPDPQPAPARGQRW